MNSVESHKVIGEGTYGCVHKEALHCKSDTGDKRNRNKLSKLMTSHDATGEMKEYVLIDNADRALQYYLGKPEQCKVSDNSTNLEAIKKCKQIGRQVLVDIDSYSLLLMEDGGINLETFGHNMKKLKNTSENQKKMELFWIEAHRLLVGLRVFLDNDIIHHDMKHPNIVYKEAENRLNFIDFGLMTSKSKVEASLRNSDYWLANYHWSFPLELAFATRYEYNKFASKSDTSKIAFSKKQIDDLTKKPNAKASYAIHTFFSNVSDLKISDALYAKVFDQFLTDYCATLLHQILPGPENYSAFIDKTLQTIDSYGVGMAYMYVLKSSMHLIDEPLVINLADLFYGMFHPNLEKRFTVDEILVKYEEILENNGILQKYDKHFVDHKLMDGPAIPPIIEKAIDAINVDEIRLSPKELSTLMVSPSKECVKGKEYNSLTKRCVKECLPGFGRNAAFKCRKNKTEKRKKSRKMKLLVECPAGKERNPKTRRCVNVCLPGFGRNAAFKCRKKNPSLTVRIPS